MQTGSMAFAPSGVVSPGTASGSNGQTTHSRSVGAKSFWEETDDRSADTSEPEHASRCSGFVIVGNHGYENRGNLKNEAVGVCISHLRGVPKVHHYVTESGFRGKQTFHKIRNDFRMQTFWTIFDHDQEYTMGIKSTFLNPNTDGTEDGHPCGPNRSTRIRHRGWYLSARLRNVVGSWGRATT